jgi:hypothetical protein
MTKIGLSGMRQSSWYPPSEAWVFRVAFEAMNEHGLRESLAPFDPTIANEVIEFVKVIPNGRVTFSRLDFVSVACVDNDSIASCGLRAKQPGRALRPL